ncbi:MAG: DUF6263 family protein [Planctomycetota bacterium]|jgi:DNA-directed RNA polymerase subunit RPC12/RpoP
MIRFACSSCSRLISVDEKHSGKKGKCPKCGGVVVVPEKSTIIEFACGTCGHKIRVPERHGSKKGACPKCKSPVVVPSPQKPPSEGAGTFSIVCSMCEETIRVPETSRGQTVECPACGSYIETSSGGVVGESDASIPQGTDEELYQEETEEYEESVGVDRHIIVGVSAVAAVVVVGLIILAAVIPAILRSSRSRPPERPEGLQGQQQVADTDSRPQPVTSDAQPTEPIVQEPSPKADSPGSEPRVTLRQQFPPGKYGIIQTETHKSVLAIEGRTVTTNESRSKWYEIDASEPDASGKTTCIVTIKRMKSTDSQGGSYDTDNPDSLRASDLEQMISKVWLNQKFVFKLGQDGKLANVSGLDRLWDSIGDGVSNEVAKANPMAAQRAAEKVVQQLKQEVDVMGDKAYVQSMLGLVDDIMPDQPVGAGAVWHKVTSEKTPFIGAAKISAEYELREIEQTSEGKIAHITCVSSIEQDESKRTQFGPMSMTFDKTDLRQEGEIQLNVDTGLIVNGRMEVHGEMEMSLIARGRNVAANSQISGATETTTKPVINNWESKESAPEPIVQEPTRRIHANTQRRTDIPVRRQTMPASNVPFDYIIVGLIGLLIGLLIAAVVLRAAAQWVASIDVEFWCAYATLFIAWLINLGVGLLLGLIVGPVAPYIARVSCSNRCDQLAPLGQLWKSPTD